MLNHGIRRHSSVWLERYLDMVEVIGSSPTAPTNKATAALFKCGGRFIV